MARDFFFFFLFVSDQKSTPPRRINPDQPTSFYTHTFKGLTMSQTAQELPKELDLDDLIHLENM